MKRILVISLALLVSGIVFAQEGETTSSGGGQIQNKNGVDIMPIAGEFGVGINATSLINNVLSNLGNGPVNDNHFVRNGGAIYGKYFLDNSTAVRIGLGVYGSNYKDREEVQNDLYSDPDSVTFDQGNYRSQDITLSLGYEMRKGKGRFRALMGADLLAGLNSSIEFYEYGNAMGAGNQLPTTSITGLNGGQRLISSTGGTQYSLGLRGFIGVEYFLAPKVALGTEFGLSATRSWAKDSENTYEFWNTTTNERAVRVDYPNKNYGDASFDIDTDSFSNTIYLMIFF